MIHAKLLLNQPHLDHGFTTQDDSLNENSLFLLNQIHSHLVIHLDDYQTIPDNFKVEGDAIITSKINIKIAVRTADCVPILLYEPEKKSIAIIHAGWKGLVSGIIENTIDQLIKKYQVDAQKIIAIIGPHICSNCFEVKEDVFSVFEDRYQDPKISINNDLRLRISLSEAVLKILTSYQITKIENLRLCTKCTGQFYSYRKGDLHKRNYSFIEIR